MNLQITKEKVLEAASKCTTAKLTLQTLFPEVFEQPKPSYPLLRGDVYIDPKGRINAFLLVAALFEGERRFSLLGRGCACNSESFHCSTLHTKQEIENYLKKDGMVYSHNINYLIYQLTASPTAKVVS